jgi:glycosyltransferase involved in cell wall biosynthesis
MYSKPLRIAIVLPIFNDWVSFAQLVRELDHLFASRPEQPVIIAVDDSSSEESVELAQAVGRLKGLGGIEIMTLITNLGHQRAIAVGLYEANRRNAFDAVVVMDADGEDRPLDVLRLIDAATDNPKRVIVARRAKRSEGPIFRLYYSMYKLLFRLMTGTSINFGNFCLIPIDRVEAFLYLPHSWNNIAAAISKSRFPMTGIHTDRGTRFSGKSKMNLVSLVLHGFSAISVYMDTIMARIILLSVFLCSVLLIAALVVVVIRLVTDMAIPGWATMAFGLSLVLIMQNILLGAGALFFLLNLRSTPSMIPAHEAGRYIRCMSRLET